MEEYLIRTAQPGDIELLRDVYRRSSLSNAGDREDLLANPDALVFDPASVHEQCTRVAVVDGRIVCFATTRVDADVMELDDLFVDPDFMRRGVGGALVRDAVAIVLAGGAKRIEVTANGHALAFYEDAGFVVAGETSTRFDPALRTYLDAAD